MNLTILNVAYPFAAVGPNAVGGAEQVLTALDAALVEVGHHSVVIASEASITRGELIAVPKCDGTINEQQRALVHACCRNAICHALGRYPVDLIHFHGVDFDEYLPPGSVPTLVTLHLPPTWYPSRIFQFTRRNYFLQPVSKSQRRSCPPSRALLPEIKNGVPVEELSAPNSKRGFALCLGRICPEKGFHIALDAAKQARMPLLLAGEIFPYEAHERYFQAQILPRLDKQRRFLGPIDFTRKRRLLSAARCLIVPSLVAETSSLVAMEALACGTPVIAFPNGALREVVEHEKTGLLVQNECEMAAAIRIAHCFDSEACRAAAKKHFCVKRMTDEYLKLYKQLARAGEKVRNFFAAQESVSLCGA